MLRLTLRACAALALLLAGCGRPLSAEECDQLLDHYTTLLAKSQNPDLRADEVDSLTRAARRQATQDPEFSQCSAKVPRRKWECAMRATAVDALEKCLL
ncbi:MAG: hypothetical protein R3B13_02320 [Polyangiaceae bacterium]